MNHKIGIILALISFSVMGCASSSGTGSSSNTAANTSEASSASVENVSGQTQNLSSEKVDPTDATVIDNVGPTIAANCRTEIIDFIQKTDGSVQVLTSDGILHLMDKVGNVKNDQKVSDNARNYILLPTTDVILHFKTDSIMVESTINGTEFFKLAGDPSKKKAYFNIDATELALMTPTGNYNVWKTEKGFGGIKLNERVQEFINRQSPDHQLGFPGDVTAISIGKDNHMAIALNETDTGKIGRLFHYDPGEPQIIESSGSSNSVKSTKTSSRTGVLKNLARANSPIKNVAISPSSNYVAAVDENGQFYFTGTINPGFMIFSKLYQDVKAVMFDNDMPIMIRNSSVTAIDQDSGLVKYQINEKYDRCMSVTGKLYCVASGYFDIRTASDGKLQQRFVFNGENYALISGGMISGNLPPACIGK